MGVLALIVLILFICMVYFWVFRGTVLEVSLIRGSYPGFFFLFGFLVSIAPATVVLNLYPIQDFWVAFKVEQGDVYWISWLILTCFLFLILFMGVIVKSRKKYFGVGRFYLPKDQILAYRKFVFNSVFFCIALIVLLWFLSDVKHALIFALVNDESTSLIRADLRNTRETRYLGYFFMMFAPLVVPIIASQVFDGKNFQRFILFFSVLVISSFAGNKGPTVTAVLMYCVSYATFNRMKISFLMVVWGGALLFAACGLVYYLVRAQYSYIDSAQEFWVYFSQRVFVAQIIGVYEQFSLNIRDPIYALHAVPFLSFFIEYPIFSKDLVMLSEDRTDPLAIGVKNTFFIAESFAIGGWYFILPSIVIFAVNYMISYVAVLCLLNKFIMNNLEFNKQVASFFFFSYFSVTGSFSDLFMFKLLIMCAVFLSPVLAIGWLGSKKPALYRRDQESYAGENSAGDMVS